MLAIYNSALAEFEKDTASRNIQNKKWAEQRSGKFHSILSSAMEQSTSPGGVNALKESIEGARAAFKSTHIANPDAGSNLAASIALAAMTLQKELKKTPDKSPNLTVKPFYLELAASIETA